MNAERLHAIAAALHAEIEDGGIVGKLQQVVNGLKQSVNQPGQGPQQALADSLTQLYSALDEAPSDQFSPSWRQILRDIDGEDLVGGNLRDQIRGILERNQITPAIALTEVKEIRARHQAFAAALQEIVSGLSHLGIGCEKLAPGECEIGILIPREGVKNKLSLLGAEMKELGFIFNTFSEVATGKKQDLEIKNVSSSDFVFYLKTGIIIAACVAAAVERVVKLYKQLLEIRKLRYEISKQGVPEQSTRGIEDYANKIMAEGITNLSVEIVEANYHKKDKGRSNELTNALNIALNKVANRVDKGYNIEVRVGPQTDSDEPEGKHTKELERQVKLIQEAAKTLQFMKLEGTPLLSLPEKATTKK